MIARGERIQQARDDGGADRRPRPVPRAAENAHQHDRQRNDDRERLARGHVRDEQRVNAARNAGERTR